jgi:hypothetical protein
MMAPTRVILGEARARGDDPEAEGPRGVDSAGVEIVKSHMPL